MSVRVRGRLLLGVTVGMAVVLLFLVVRFAPVPDARATAPAEGQPWWDRTVTVDSDTRLDALRRAQVWRQPLVPVSSAYLGQDPSRPQQIDCAFQLNPPSGTTPKFDCVTDSGEQIRIKYGIGAELPAEAAATRLLSALGFGADSVTRIERLRCFGCPKEPFTTARLVAVMHAENLYGRFTTDESDEMFPWVAVERRFPAPAIEADGGPGGWAFYELEKIDTSKGGAPRAHVDALRLMAVFLAHWDNKSDNQRLVCLTRHWSPDTPCPEPFLLLHDVGSTFGPRKVDLSDWERAAIWSDRRTCTISMRELPTGGATFGSVRIGEEGRLFLADLLGSLTDRQLVDLFEGARFGERRGIWTPDWPASEWARVFKARRDAIAEGPPCPRV